MWVILCIFKLPDYKKDFSYRKQLNSFSPVWDRWCCWSSWDDLKALPQCEQITGFSSVWDSWCSLRLWDVFKALSHSKHSCIFSLVWDSVCLFRLLKWEKGFSHREQLNSFLLFDVVGVPRMILKLCHTVSSQVAALKYETDSVFWVPVMFNRPGVAGAVLQSPPSFTDSLINWVILQFKYLPTTVNPKPEKPL